MIVPGQTPDGEWPLVKILNFGGVPATVSASEFSTGRTGRSADFASPEQLKGYPVDFRSEIYSLGCTMWFLLTGAPPIPGATDKAGVVPRALRPILAQMVALDPMQRPQDPVALQEQLRDCLAVLERRGAVAHTLAAPVAAASASAVSSGPRPSQLLKPLALAAAVLLFAGIVALALPYLRHSATTEAEPIGVPVGVADKSADAAASAVPGIAAAPSAAGVPTQSTPVPTATPTAVIAAASAAPSAEPEQALVSVEPPRPSDSAAPENAAPAAEENAAQTAAVASNTTPDQSPAAQLPDNDGGRRVASTTPAERSTPQQPDARTASSSSSARERSAAATPEPTRAAVAKTTPKPASKIARAAEVRRAEPPDDIGVNAPTVPRGAKRARYLGTTPEGDLVFGLPSDQRGYVAPPGSDNRRRRVRGANVERPANPEMVLPAEPVEPDGEHD
jgi:serine/threonine-protein kinase